MNINSKYPDICIVVNCNDSEKKGQATTLSRKLHIPLTYSLINGYNIQLVYTEERLELQYNPHLQKGYHTPVSVDFSRNTGLYRRIRSATIRDPLARAVGIKQGIRPSILDTTAGFGLDGITLACLGCKVTMIERSPIIHALLDDGLARAAADPFLNGIIKNNLSLLHGNAIDIIGQLTFPSDTVLLDPMYPQAKNRALNKIEMRILREVVGDDADSLSLFAASLGYAHCRVVVKRPKGAAEIALSPSPSHRVAMKSGHFDVYIKTE